MADSLDRRVSGSGDYGKIAATEYGHTCMTAQRVEALETALAAWLATKPGAFSSPDACGLYEKALAQFSQWSGRSEDRDNFAVTLSRLGYRAGVVVYDGEPRWLLILPSSVDTALTRLAAAEVRPA